MSRRREGVEGKSKGEVEREIEEIVRMEKIETGRRRCVSVYLHKVIADFWKGVQIPRLCLAPDTVSSPKSQELLIWHLII